MTTTKTIWSSTFTCSDVARPVLHSSLFFHTANFHITTFDCYYGDGTHMLAIGQKDAVISLDKGDMKDLYFMNKTAGSNCVIQIVATIDTEETSGAE